MHLTARAFRECLDWDAKCLVLKGRTYLDYDYDWILNENVQAPEVMDYAKDCDFFIFQDLIHLLPECPLGQFLDNRNTAICATGSNARKRIDALHMQQMRMNINIVTALHDSTIADYLYSSPFDATIIDTNLIEKLSMGVKKHDKFSVVHATTSEQLKGTYDVREVMERFDDDVIYTEIAGRPWKDCIKEKAKHLVTVDQLWLPAYGVTSLESLALGQYVVSNISPWCYAHLPDLPIENIGPFDAGVKDRLFKTLSELKYLYEEGGLYWSSNNAEYAREHFGMYNVAQRWKYYIDFVKSGENIR